ncbi:BTB/POZ domain-containing protein [Aphelenchoides avenae]|nr:BTB/POZ domain-containing protein [Aphelenchus avenae]
MASADSIVESKKVTSGGVQWYTVSKSFVENGTTYLAYYLRGTKGGRWRRWLNAEFYIARGYVIRNSKSMSSALRISSAENACAEWGFDKFVSKETLLGNGDFVRNDELHLSLWFSYGVDIFFEKSEAHHTNVKLLVQGQPVFVNKDLLSIHSPVFERLFKEWAVKQIALQEANLAGFLHFLRVVYPPHEGLNAATVKDIHQMAKTYGVVYLLEKCEKHILGSMELSLADKLALADEVDNNKLFGVLVRSLDEPSLKEFAINADVHVQLRDKVMEHHFRQQPRHLNDPPLALQKVLFAQDTKDEVLLACVIGNLTKREIAHLKRVEHRDKYTKETLMALFGKAYSLIP